MVAAVVSLLVLLVAAGAVLGAIWWLEAEGGDAAFCPFLGEEVPPLPPPCRSCPYEPPPCRQVSVV